MSDSSSEPPENPKSTSKRTESEKDAGKAPKKTKSSKDKDGKDPTKSKGKREGSSASLTAKSDKDEKASVQKTKAISQSLKELSAGLADFQKLREIGKGAIGKVYLVKMKKTDQIFAMKVVKKYDMVQRNKVKRILTEREILATADHPFIVDLYYSFQSKHSLVFIMEYCAGGEFYRIIQRQPFRCLKEIDARFYAAEVLSALEYLHKMGFIYRDLKPENVLLHATGHIMLTDFDLSKGASAPVQPRVVTKMFSGAHGVVSEPDLVTNSFVGTEEYLAPEVVQGTGHNATVDWWTFGILMYEMLYGTTPFRGTTRDDTFSNIRKTSINFPEHKRGGVSKECQKLLKHLLHRDPQKRLGAVGGATDIKDHPFFKDIKWATLHEQTPPIIPKVEPIVVDEKLQEEDSEEEIDTAKLDASHPFKNFSNIDLTERADGNATGGVSPRRASMQASQSSMPTVKEEGKVTRRGGDKDKKKDRDSDSESSERKPSKKNRPSRKDSDSSAEETPRKSTKKSRKPRDSVSDSSEEPKKRRPKKSTKESVSDSSEEPKKVPSKKPKKTTKESDSESSEEPKKSTRKDRKRDQDRDAESSSESDKKPAKRSSKKPERDDDSSTVETPRKKIKDSRSEKKDRSSAKKERERESSSSDSDRPKKSRREREKAKKDVDSDSEQSDSPKKPAKKPTKKPRDRSESESSSEERKKPSQRDKREEGTESSSEEAKKPREKKKETRERRRESESDSESKKSRTAREDKKRDTPREDDDRNTSSPKSDKKREKGEKREDKDKGEKKDRRDKDKGESERKKKEKKEREKERETTSDSE